MMSDDVSDEDVVVVVVDDTSWVYLSSDHPFQVYYKVRQLVLLQNAMVC